jgi:hypothetical protein
MRDLHDVLNEMKYISSYTIQDINTFCQMLMDTCPKAGGGVHQWLFEAARAFHRWPFHFKPNTIIRLLTTATEHCGRLVQQHEIVDAVSNSDPASPTHLGNTSYTSALPVRLPEFRDAIIKASEDPPVSPTKYAHLTSQKVLQWLFPDDPLLCFAKDKYNAKAIRWSKLNGWIPPLMVPSPLLGPAALTKEGRKSCRALANIGERLYLIIEFDEGELDDQAKLLWSLRIRQRLVMIVYSGKKSLHGWFRLEDKRLLKAFCDYAYQIGCDSATFGKQQLVRVPNAIRPETGKQQTVIYTLADL